MNEAAQELFNRASRKWKEGDLPSALSIVTDLIADKDCDSVFLSACLTLRGGIYQDLGVLGAACADFEQLVHRKPLSRFASALYYNALVESKKLKEANSEGLRFLRTLENRIELTELTQSYVETILYNLLDSEDWSHNGDPNDIEMVLARRKAQDQESMRSMAKIEPSERDHNQFDRRQQ